MSSLKAGLVEESRCKMMACRRHACDADGRFRPQPYQARQLPLPSLEMRAGFAAENVVTDTRRMIATLRCWSFLSDDYAGEFLA